MTTIVVFATGEYTPPTAPPTADATATVTAAPTTAVTTSHNHDGEKTPPW